MGKLTIWKEIKKQLTNTPSFTLKMPTIEQIEREHLDQLDQQIEKAVQNRENRLVILLGPFGAGKTTQIHYFLRKRPSLRYVYKSLIKVNTLDLAFLHLTNYVSRCCFMLLSFLVGVLLIQFIPGSGALPFLLMIGYFFVKNVGNLIYILHEVLDNLFVGKDWLVILEDLERSSLNSSDQWALLANLWQLKRRYLISLGYPTDDKKAKLQVIECAQKLGGIIIEVLPYKNINYSLIHQADPSFPFEIDAKPFSKKGAWMSLFTPREMLLIQEQATLRTLPEGSSENKKNHYIQVCLELLLDKLSLENKRITFDDASQTFKNFSLDTLSPEQAYFLSAFKESVVLKTSSSK